MIAQPNVYQTMAVQQMAAERTAREERARFKRHFPILILEEAPDARGQPRFLYPNVESMFAGWSAAHAQINGEALGGARDSERLNFLARHEAHVAWSADRSCCAVFRYDDEGCPVPMTTSGDGWPTAREAIDAAEDAQQGEAGAA